MELEKLISELNLKTNTSPMEIDNFNSFFVITATFSIFAIYVGFRGTLTADFQHIDAEVKKFLILPIFLYLPTTLLYSFYPRYILKKIYDNDILKKINLLDSKRGLIQNEKSSIKEKLEIEKIILEVKEKLIVEKNKLPVIGLKDSPSLLLSILIFIQYVSEKDSIISEFLKYIW